jgi:hypothetical protein
MAEESVVAKPRYWRLLELAAAAIYVASIIAIILIFRNPEWHGHLLRLTHQSWGVFVAQDIGSTRRGFLNGCLEAIFGIAAVAVMTGYFLGWKELRKHWIETAIVALVAFPTVTFVIYGTQFAWEVAKVGYEDHASLVLATSQSSQLRSQVTQLTTDKSALEDRLAKKPSTVTKTVTAPPAPPDKQCWLADHFGMPNSTIKGAVTATAAILHCNYRVDSPLKVVVEFDRDFIPGALVMPGAGMVMGVGGGKNGRVYEWRVDGPALPSEHLVVVTVYGPTDQYPRALRGEIATIQ